MNGLYLTDISSWEHSIPTHLQDFLFSQENIGARYCRLGEGAQSNLHSDSDKIRTYLGTYFPRSFCESQNLHTLLLGLDQVRQGWCHKDRIQVLDFGSGTGGNICGLIQALSSLGINATVCVYSVDGNREALSRQEEIISHMQRHTDIRVELNIVHKVFPNDPEGFATEFRSLVDELPGQFDLFMAWKSLSELFIADQTSPFGSYGHFFEIGAPLLNKDGFLTVLDVTMKSRHQWLPTVLTRDLKRFINAQDDVELVMPFGCAQRRGHCALAGCYPKFDFPIGHRYCHGDRTKFAFFALGRKALASSILAAMPAEAPCPEECGRNGGAYPTPAVQFGSF